MNIKIPEDEKKIKISICLDPKIDKMVEKIIIDKKFYKKSRFIEFLIKKYAEENDYQFKEPK